jgi:hypothetical protein
MILQRTREQIAKPFHDISRLAVTALTVAIIALFAAVAALGVSRAGR